MKPVSEYLPQQSKPKGYSGHSNESHSKKRHSNESHSNPTTTPSRDSILELFGKMLVRYGHVWRTQYPTDEIILAGVNEWRMVLSGLSDSDIEYGLNNWSGPFPPNAYTFREVCQPHRKAAHKPYKALPRPNPSKALAREHIALIRAALANTGKAKRK